MQLSFKCYYKKYSSYLNALSLIFAQKVILKPIMLIIRSDIEKKIALIGHNSSSWRL